MAVRLNATYSKRLGLPGYSSHQFSVSVETELVTTDDVAAESRRLYDLLQTNVDEQIGQQPGFVPPGDYGCDESAQPRQPQGSNGSGPASSRWKCSDKQKELILKLVDEHQLDKNEVEELAQERFGKGVSQLGKLEASGLLDELLEAHGGKGNGRRGNRRNAYQGNGRRGSA